MTASNAASWSVGQSTVDGDEMVFVTVQGTSLFLSVAAATQFATALLIAAKNVEAASAANAVNTIPLPSTTP